MKTLLEFWIIEQNQYLMPKNSGIFLLCSFGFLVEGERVLEWVQILRPLTRRCNPTSLTTIRDVQRIETADQVSSLGRLV